MSEFPIQCTIKPPAQWASAPWLNFQAQDESELTAQIKEAFPTVEADSLAELVAKAYTEYAAVLNAVLTPAAGAVSASVAAQNSVPQAEARPDFVSPAAPNLAPPAPQCHHGEKVYKSGQGKNGPWAAWMCRAVQNDPGKCKPVDAKTGQAWK